MHRDTESLIRALVGGDDASADHILDRARTDDNPTLLVAAAALAPARPDRTGRDAPAAYLARAARHATTTPERQLVAITAAYLDQDEDRFEALVRDHLAEHPGSLVASWMAGKHADKNLRKGHAMNTNGAQRTAATMMAGAAALAIAGFTALGEIFEYPQILKSPTAEIMTRYQENQGPISAWFLVLVVSAALLGPVGVLLGRAVGGARGRWIAGIGVAAAAVQVVGLSRWVLLVPGVVAKGQTQTFERLHFWLGTIIGETIGYALTATFTALVAAALAPRWMAYLGYAAATLIATGVVIPLGVSIASLTNFAGYVIWCLWLIGMAAVLLRRAASQAPSIGNLG